MAEAEAKTRVRTWLKRKRMADTKAETELTADDIEESFSRAAATRATEEMQYDARYKLAQYVAQQNRAYVKRLCDEVRKTPADGAFGEGWDEALRRVEQCADYIEREGGKDG